MVKTLTCFSSKPVGEEDKIIIVCKINNYPLKRIKQHSLSLLFYSKIRFRLSAIGFFRMVTV